MVEDDIVSHICRLALVAVVGRIIGPGERGEEEEEEEEEQLMMMMITPFVFYSFFL